MKREVKKMDFDAIFKSSWKVFWGSIINSILFVLVGMLLSLTIILIPTVIGGFSRGFIKLIRDGKTLDFSELLNFDKYFSLLLLLLVGGSLITLGYILLFIPGLVLTVFWFYAAYFIVDKNLGFWDAMMASHAAVKKTGFLQHLLLIIIISVLTAMGSSVVFGAILTMPFCFVLATRVYLDISKA
jgi:hypothetical protein